MHPSLEVRAQHPIRITFTYMVLELYDGAGVNARKNIFHRFPEKQPNIHGILKAYYTSVSCDGAGVNDRKKIRCFFWKITFF